MCPIDMCFLLRTTLVGLLIPIAVGAQNDIPDFLDVPKTHPSYASVMYLRSQGMLGGYSDGTFKPSQLVDHSAALKMALAGRVTQEQVASLKNPGFTDVPADAWYVGFAAKAVELGIIDGPPKAVVFNGSRPVILAEYLKMLMLAQGMNPDNYNEFRMAFSSDVNDEKAWFYPYIRLGLATSTIQIDEQGMLHPSKKLTRADVADLDYRLLMYKASRRAQALLLTAETELSGNFLNNLKAETLAFAKMAGARAMIAVRGALTIRPDVVVKGAVKVAEGFNALGDAFEAGIGGRPDDAIGFAKKAYQLGEQAKQFSSTLSTIVTSMQQIAAKMADEARAVKGQ